MTSEEVNRTIEFLLEHQAKVSADIERLNAVSERHEREIARHNGELRQLTDLVGRLAQAEIRLVERIDALAVAHKETDERLSALIVTVERYIAGHNGGLPGQPKAT